MESITLKDAATVCHELRKPIAAVRAFAEILADEISGALNDEQQQHVATILRSSERLDEQVTSLYELVEVWSGGPRLERAPCDVELLGARTQDALAPAFRERGVALHLLLDGDLVHEGLDARRLERALRRLLENALAASSKGGDVTLSMRNEEGTLVVEVLDEGPGLPGGWSPSATTPFRDDGEGGGLGIGLVLCHAVVAAHGGRLSAEQRARGGACFRVELPPVGAGIASSEVAGARK